MKSDFFKAVKNIQGMILKTHHVELHCEVMTHLLADWEVCSTNGDFIAVCFLYRPSLFIYLVKK